VGKSVLIFKYGAEALEGKEAKPKKKARRTNLLAQGAMSGLRRAEKGIASWYGNGPRMYQSTPD
jgi:rare lipoprotein A (peptidoglycan hydrolase)